MSLFPELGQNLEKTLAETNLVMALRDMERELFRVGIVKVSAEGVAQAKSPRRENGLQIELRGGITNIALIKLIFTHDDGKTEEIIITGWQDEDNHLSGAASPETFATRIREALFLRNRDEVIGEDWSHWGEKRQMSMKEILTTEFLLANHSQLELKPLDKNQALNFNEITYGVCIKGTDKMPVVIVIDSFAFGGTLRLDKVEILKDRVESAIRRALITNQQQVVRWENFRR